MSTRILVCDDDGAIRFALQGALEREGYKVQAAASGAEALAALRQSTFDVFLLDLQLPDMAGLDVFAAARADEPAMPIIIVSGTGDIPTAIDAIRRGADEFLTKPVGIKNLLAHIVRASEIGRLRKRESARQRLQRRAVFDFDLEDPAIREVHELARIAAASEATVLLLGETGTGKSVLARWIHDHGGRAGEEFVAVNCAELAGELLSSELFGHARGAFTSAIRDREGLVEVADRGTLFLDEISEMGVEAQARLLKVLEEKTFRRLGETKIRSSDFRLICATNADLAARVEAGTFRRDLYYRLQIFPIRLPPVRERPKGLLRIVARTLAACGYRYSDEDLPAEVAAILAGYGWPGNVRELQNVVERAVLLARGERLTAACFPWLAMAAPVGTLAIGEAAGESRTPLEHAELTQIREALRLANHDVDEAARRLGISRASLYRRLRKYGIRRPPRDSNDPR